MIRRKVLLHTAYHLLRITNRMLDWLEQHPPKPPTPHVDEPITDTHGDPGARYVPDAPPVFKIIPGGAE